MTHKALTKRLIAAMLCLSLLLGLLPMQAFAQDAPQPLASGETTENASVTVDYKDADRSKATITYHKPGVDADAYNLIFLVDSSRQGAESHEAFEQMMRERGMRYIYDYDAPTTVNLISYQYSIMNDDIVCSTKEELSEAINSHPTAGEEGTANEVNALKAATNAVQPGKQNIVFWVLGEKFGNQDTAAIETELQNLKTALGNDGTLITWQMADQPNALLEQYATEHTVAHPEDENITGGYLTVQ
ncbi:MAG: hypothetical protein UDB11_05825 [Peptococcaceae bacterium]|nr:hypothetical protein [Peptococcaceae bacterium]